VPVPRCPVDLRLLTSEDIKAQERFLRSWTQTSHHAPQLLDASSVAAIPKRLMQPCGAKSQMRFQRLAHQAEIRIEHRRTQLFGAMKTLHLDGAPHRVVMNSERLGYRAYLPVLGEKK
jgi:hypothetical protein